MQVGHRWVLLAYRLPREPSTPRIALWRRLRQLGAVQLQDGLVGLPLGDQTREQLEWLAESVIEAGGEASVWLAEPAARSQAEALVGEVQSARSAEYRAVVKAAEGAWEEASTVRRRTIGRLRRDLRRIRSRDYLGASGRVEAEAAVEALAASEEVAT
jgi:hypothetical protein